MDIFNYVMVLASVIIGLSMTHLLQGVAGIVQNPGREKIYWVHLVWVAAIFLRTIFWWWFQFRLSETGQWSFGLYFFVLVYALLIFLACAFLFPRDLAGHRDFEEYFYSSRAWFFGINLAGVAIDVIDSLAKGFAHFRALGLFYPIMMAVLATLLAIAMHTRSKRFHAALAVGSLVYLLVYPAISFNVVQGAASVAKHP